MPLKTSGGCGMKFKRVRQAAQRVYRSGVVNREHIKKRYLIDGVDRPRHRQIISRFTVDALICLDPRATQRHDEVCGWRTDMPMCGRQNAAS